MALVRAFTKRNKRPEVSPPSPTRMTSIKRCDGLIDRTTISAPLELISTTNVLAYNAPDIYSSSSSTTNSDSEADSSSTSVHTADTTPDSSSIESSRGSMEPNHLSCYFRASSRSSSSASSHHQSNASRDANAPAIPQRALSHTKKTHQALAHKRSVSKMTPPPNCLSTTSYARSSLDMFAGKVEPNHPFGKELEQVNELAEEFGISDVAVFDEEEGYLVSHGLMKFGAEDYLMEIQGLFGGVFEDRLLPVGSGWI
ncbi:MAG: hypothetical protein M1830_006272 [Pleopsidium flavum]|nr:MAG: hypothetical protein M1830_006272 [Pleopsidium flavum]